MQNKQIENSHNAQTVNGNKKKLMTYLEVVRYKVKGKCPATHSKKKSIPDTLFF